MNSLWSILFIFILILDIYYLYVFFKDGKIIKGYSREILTQQDLKLLEDAINCMDGREFELFTCKLFHLLGYKTQLTPISHDEGRDIILTDSVGETTFVECKAWHGDKLAGREILEKLIGACALYDVKKALLVTTGGLHQNAFDYTDRVNKIGNYDIELWTMYDIIKKAKEIGNTDVLKIAGIEKKNLKLVYDSNTTTEA